MKSDILVEKFGKILMEKVRDEVCNINERLMDGKIGGAENQHFFEKAKNMNYAEKELFLSFARKTIDCTIHYFLWMIEEEENLDIVYKDKLGDIFSLKQASDGLYGEPYGQDGWVKKFSKYPETID